MTMRKLLALTGISCLAAAGLLSCATARPPSRWHRFAPTRSNFRAYFAERRQSLDPIEGIWNWSTAVVRDSSYAGYDFVAVHMGTGHGGNVAVVFRRAERDSLYYFHAAHVLRGDPCLARPCEGTVVVKDGVLQFPVRYVIHSRRSYCWRIDEYWAKTYPAGS